MKIRPSLLPCAALLLCGLSAQAQSPSAELQARITRVEQGLSAPVVRKGAADQKMDLAKRMAFYQVPAVSIALINGGRIEWARAYGMADAASQRAATTATLFQAASVSKAVTTLGALNLVERGKLALDGDVNRQLSAWKVPQNEFTQLGEVSLRRLLNHSAGATVHGYRGYAQGQQLPTLLQILDGTAPANSGPVRIDIVPASTWCYSGGGFSIVQLMMTEASGQPFDQTMKTTVLDPLGMNSSTFTAPLPPSKHNLAATAYLSSGKAVVGQWNNYPESAAAGLWTTPSDLARVVLEVQQAGAGKGKILSRAMTSTMLTRGLGEYGLGFFVEELSDRTSFSHSGGTEGFRAHLYGYTPSGQGVVIMTNSDNGMALIEEIMRSVSAEYGWPEFKVVEKSVVPGDAAVNKQLAGDYRLEDKPAYIVAEGPRLYLQSELFGAKRMELFAESAAAFFMTAQDMSIRFERRDDGAITGFDLVSGGSTYKAVRK